MSGQPFDSRAFISSENVNNQETQVVSTTPSKNAKRVIGVDSSGNVTGGFNLPAYDYVSMALSGGNTTETYTFKSGGAGGSTVATVVVVYTDSTRTVLSTATKT